MFLGITPVFVGVICPVNYIIPQITMPEWEIHSPMQILGPIENPLLGHIGGLNDLLIIDIFDNDNLITDDIIIWEDSICFIETHDY